MIIINIDKAKAIGHDLRRAKRAEEFAPLDRIVAAQIPGNASVEAEALRQAIRDKYTIVQEQIDLAQTPEEIKEALGGE